MAHLEGAVMALQLAAEALELAAGQDSLAVLAAQVVLLLHQLALLLLQELHLLLGVPVLFQLETGTEEEPRGDSRVSRVDPTPVVTAQARHHDGASHTDPNNPKGPTSRIQKWTLRTNQQRLTASRCQFLSKL